MVTSTKININAKLTGTDDFGQCLNGLNLIEKIKLSVYTVVLYKYAQPVFSNKHGNQ